MFDNQLPTLGRVMGVIEKIHSPSITISKYYFIFKMSFIFCFSKSLNKDIVGILLFFFITMIKY